MSETQTGQIPASPNTEPAQPSPELAVVVFDLLGDLVTDVAGRVGLNPDQLPSSAEVTFHRTSGSEQPRTSSGIIREELEITGDSSSKRLKMEQNRKVG